MSEREFRRRHIPATRRSITKTRAPRPSPETRLKIKSEAEGKLSWPPENAKVLISSKSEPLLWDGGGVEEAAAVEEEAAEVAGVLYRRQTCTDIFSSPPVSAPQSPRKCSQVYNKEAKVVVNVTVEGSPGPIRTMVKLGSNVEETINLVINKYNEEGRTPYIDKDAAAKFELHHSYFSLESLNNSDLIGDVGSRSFYLRKGSSDGDRANDVVCAISSNQLPAASLSFLPSFISRKITRIIRRTRKFWKLFGCIP